MDDDGDDDNDDDDNTAPPIDDVAPSNAAVPAIVDYDFINTDLAY